MFLLDTNVVSELRKTTSGRANTGVATWAASVSSAVMFVSAITMHELEHGILLAERSDFEKGQILRAWFDVTVIPAFVGRVIPVDHEVAVRSAALHVPDPAPYRDAFIGATALVHAMTLVTRNTKDFERFPNTVIFNPWT
jgi:toxin FitB